jgi:hypothetical protein
LTSITNPIATIFTSPKVPTQAVFLDEEEAKLVESSDAASKGVYKRVELKVGGMTVRCHLPCGNLDEADADDSAELALLV